jgi:D-amino-acid dehydrogenase
MKIVVLGAGVVGITTAYTAAKSGHEVHVVERHSQAASENSNANGGQLSFGFASPMGSPEMLRKLPAILARRHEAFRFHPSLNAATVKWCAKFLPECMPGRSAANRAALSDLCQQSEKAFVELQRSVSFEFDHRSAGKVVLYRSPEDAERFLTSLTSHWPSQGYVMGPEQCIEREPELASMRNSISAGLFFPGDQLGDCARFTNGLARQAQRQFGAVIHYNRDVSAIEIEGASVRGVQLQTGEHIHADAVVCCTGASTALLNAVGVCPPIIPIYGYSLTAPALEAAPSVAITDMHNKLVCSRIGDQMRFAGFADVGNFSTNFLAKRHQQFKDRVMEIFPKIADYSAIHSEWIGARPSTPNSLPLIGESKISGLYLNMGHGMFGWTLAAGSASKLVQHLQESVPQKQAA